MFVQYAQPPTCTLLCVTLEFSICCVRQVDWLRQRIKLPILCACVFFVWHFFSLCLFNDKAFGRHSAIHVHLIFISIFSKSWSENSTRTIRKWKTIVRFLTIRLDGKGGEREIWSECVLSAIACWIFFRFNKTTHLKLEFKSTNQMVAWKRAMK